MCVVVCVTLSVIGKIQTNYYIPIVQAVLVLKVMSGQTEMTHTEQAALRQVAKPVGVTHASMRNRLSSVLVRV